MIEIIPAIDIINGECVRLSQGDYNSIKRYYKEPLDIAKMYEDMGIKRLHIVDLDGAKSVRPQNLDVAERVCANCNLTVQYGGGIKSNEAISSLFESGVQYAIIGSVAVTNPTLFSGWLDSYGDKIILGADVKSEVIAINGWLENSGISIYDLIERYKNLKRVICTDISCDGMLNGPNYELYNKLKAKYSDIEITVSGGISSFSDIRRLDSLNHTSVIVGKAMYEGCITNKEIEEWLQKE